MSLDEELMDGRVGKATISIIRDYLKEYVKFNTKKGVYQGNPDYIIKLKYYEEILNENT